MKISKSDKILVIGFCENFKNYCIRNSKKIKLVWSKLIKIHKIIDFFNKILNKS